MTVRANTVLRDEPDMVEQNEGKRTVSDLSGSTLAIGKEYEGMNGSHQVGLSRRFL
jgi:hypothetical protein